MRRLLYLVLLSAMGGLFCSWVAAAEPLIKLDLSGQAIEGTPLSYSAKKVWFLGRDGQLVEFDSTEASHYSQVGGGFRSYSQAEIRGQLQREFPQYEVSGVGHYLVVHPAGKRDQWAPRFEELFRSFTQYFSARGWQLSEPRFPLVAIVYPRQVDFWQAAARDGMKANMNVLGYYSPITNRILMFDTTASQHGGDWTTNADTIVHEAAHQSAYNTSVHTRFGESPRWLVEGLGTMFEARGVWQSRTYQNQPDRINRGRLEAWRSYAKNRRKPDAIAQIVSSDRMFANDAEGAYAEAWALSFFLCETAPKKYFELLGKAAARPAFADYPAAKRLEDFTSIFDSDLSLLDARMQRFITGLK